MLCGGLTQNEFYFLRMAEAIAISVSGSAVHLWCQGEEGSVFLEADVADSYNYHRNHILKLAMIVIFVGLIRNPVKLSKCPKLIDKPYKLVRTNRQTQDTQGNFPKK